jgi:two-component system, LuxR family, response regulator FixJ
MTSDDKPLIYLVDDDDAIRRSAGFMLKTSGYRVETYASGVEFLNNARNLEPGCILLDIRMPGMDGLEVQQALANKGITLPVIIMTGHGDVGSAVKAMKAGAVEFIEKPFEKSVLLSAIEQGFNRLDRAGKSQELALEAETRLQALSPRELDVLRGLADGLPNKSIAYALGISPRTVEIHRARMMDKLAVRNLSEALRIAFAAESAAPDQ